jgi:hypothetical protein
MLAPDFDYSDQVMRFNAADTLIRKWNIKYNVRRPEPTVPFETSGWNPKPDRRRKRRSRQHEEQW